MCQASDPDYLPNRRQTDTRPYSTPLVTIKISSCTHKSSPRERDEREGWLSSVASGSGHNRGPMPKIQRRKEVPKELSSPRYLYQNGNNGIYQSPLGCRAPHYYSSAAGRAGPPQAGRQAAIVPRPRIIEIRAQKGTAGIGQPDPCVRLRAPDG